MKKNKLKILILADEKDRQIWNELSKSWEKYFDIELIIDDPKYIKKYLNYHIDILFLGDESKFHLSYYKFFKKSNKLFTYVVAKKEPESKDVEIFKNLADKIVYTGVCYDYFKWSTIATLRRHWSSYSKSTTVIYKEFIVDFLNDSYIKSKKPFTLSPIEAKLFRFLLNNRSKFCRRSEILKNVWGFKEDTTRVMDQMLYKLKKKIGHEYFVSNRMKGIKFE